MAKVNSKLDDAIKAWRAINKSARDRLIADIQLCAAGIQPRGSKQQFADIAECLLRAAANDAAGPTCGDCGIPNCGFCSED